MARGHGAVREATKEASMKSDELDVPTEVAEKQVPEGGISRRTFVKRLGAVSAGISFLASGVRFAHAQKLALDLGDKQLLDLYATMLKMRWWDRAYADRLLTDTKFRSYGHIWYPYSGQEAVATGVCAALSKDDWITTGHRSSGQLIAKGSDLKELTAGILMKANGLSGGYGASMHWTDKSVGYMFSTGIVGPAAVVTAGMAAGFRARGTKQVAVAFAGDGSHASPYFHVALNEAAVLKLPFVYVIENNLYAASSYYKQETHLTDIATSAEGYQIASAVVDGQNVLSTYAAAKEAVDRARAGEGPTLLEAKTYRYYGHSGGAGIKVGQTGSFGLPYRSDREVRAWMARDPLEIHKRTLIILGLINEAGAQELEEKAKAEVAAAFRFADDSPVPRAEDALKNVYVAGTVAPRQLPDTPVV
jgi:pyruvate dehydrogenase E1 component alpha subunit